MPTAFPPAARLHSPSEYAAALKGRHVARGALFIVSGTRQTVGDRARLGMIVPKRHVPLAVNRNAIKRVLRESFRSRQHELPARDWVFRLVRRPQASSLSVLKRQVRVEADALLDKVATC